MIISIDERIQSLMTVRQQASDITDSSYSAAACVSSPSSAPKKTSSTGTAPRAVSPISVMEDVSPSSPARLFNNIQKTTSSSSVPASILRKAQAKKKQRKDQINSSKKAVSFVWPIVTSVKTRPRTRTQDVSKLFYSSQETTQFRQDYYAFLENGGSDEVDSEEESLSLSNKNKSLDNDDSVDEQDHYVHKAKRVRRAVSKVVVSHNGSTREYFQPSPCLSPTDHSVFSSSAAAEEEFCFDSPEFWNGTLTWYSE
eukprot:CAMPEP_0178960338 /NCGR_PEP_ID=MMETSP0789-20121207/12907_1 /TAXON_ID=3005 /ORGANISM="Rhizosolenia setigera, Strain CCMP 1694" /LENGTH=254 /DNA_ID=CAMNT_0020643673 /DNA_START=113 /DNA_END=877 /DNA_ORIENTATION=+